MKVMFSMLVMILAQSIAWAGQGSNNCSRFLREGDTTSVCSGRQLPMNKTRGIKNRRLVCPGNADTFIRQPQIIENFEDWAAAIKVDGSRSQAAFEMRRKQPDIAWKGRIPYSTVEMWEWVDCVYGTSASNCGTRRECREVQVSYNDCDSQNRCTTRYKPETQCEQVPNSCWYDEVKTESLHCSQESMTYDARFERDSNWNPKSENYNEFIPNKYDLLPGEVESIQVFNNSSAQSVMSPKVEIGDAWNKYSTRLTGSGVGAQCRQNAREHVSVRIFTEGRIKKQSPNAFRLPVRFDGKAIQPLIWSLSTDKEGQEIKTKPVTLRLSDASSAMVALMARQSRENADREVVKDQNGLNTNPDKQTEEQSSKMKGFFKNTEVRIKLVEDKWWGKSKFSRPVTMKDVEAVATANYRMSQSQEIRNSDFWIIPLNDPDSGVDLYKRDNWLAKLLGGKVKALKPSQRYLLQISMFQAGVPFYFQGCSNDPNMSKFKCFFGMQDHYSKPLEVPFWTDKNYDERSFLQKLNQFTLVDWLHRKYRERTPGEDNAVTGNKKGSL